MDAGRCSIAAVALGANVRIQQVIAYDTVANDGLRLWGVQDADTVDVTLQRLDHRNLFRLLR